MDNLSIDLEIRDDKAEVVIGRSRQRIQDFVNDVENKQPTLKFKVAGESFIELDKLEKRAAATRDSFRSIAAVRIDAGQINNLTRELVAAAERSRQLQSDITNIKRELANPNRKSSIAFLTDELRAAEKEADALNRKLSLFASSGAGGAGRATDAAGRPTDLRLSSFQKTNLTYQANDIATMAALGANPTQILASQAGQIAQIFSPEQIAAFTAKYAALIPILGLGTAALALTYKITGDIRDAAERRLKTEEKIAATLNKQRLTAQDLTNEFNKNRKDDDEARRIQYFIEDNPIEIIRARRQTLQEGLARAANDVTAYGAPQIAAMRNELTLLDNQIKDFERKQQLAAKKAPDEAFDQRKADFKRNQELERQSIERKQLEDYKKAYEAAEKFKKSVEDGKEKIKQLGRVWDQTFDGLFTRANSNNPLVAVFSDAKKALDKLRQDLRGLPPELQQTAIALQQRINARQLFEARLDNQLSVFDLRSDAANFRNPYDAEKDSRQQERYIQDFLRRNPNYLFLKQQEYEGEERVSGYKNPLSFEEFYRRDILKNIRGNPLFDTPQNRLNKRLEDQYNLIYRAGMSQDELAIADRKFISATSGVNAADLSDKNRELAAQVREREAARREGFEKDALDVAKKQLEATKAQVAAQKKFNELVEAGGLEALKAQVEILDKSNGGARVLGATPKPSDMPAPNLGFSNDGGLTNF